MSAFEELRRQLVDSVAERSRVNRSPAEGLVRWWRGRVGVPLIAMVPLVFILVTLGTTLVSRLDAGSFSAPPVRLLEASAAEGPCGPCRAVGGRLHAPPSEEAAAGEASTTPSRRDVRIRHGRPIVRLVAPHPLTGASRLG